MELGKQIKKYRTELSLSQDELAEKIYVSRQTISNLENDKSYPDVHSLILLSQVFQTSIDTLIKGDIEIMKEQVHYEDQKKFNTLSTIYTTLLLVCILTPIPLTHFLEFVGSAIWAVIMAVTLYVAVLVEKEKKRLNIQTWREIVAFTEGKTLDEISKAREEGKRPYQKILLAIGAGLITLLIAILFGMLLK